MKIQDRINARRLALLAASMLAGLVPAIHVLAADNAPTDNAAQTQTKLEEVVVTARKQSERLQDVPVTVNALTAQTVEKLEIKNIFDLSQVTPGVYFGTTGGRNGGNKLQIRNFSTGTAGPSKASVFLDGVYLPGDYASIPLANLERIEVLKGPQSAYFGRATEVGGVNFITRDPGSQVTGAVDLYQASLKEHDYTGFVEAPLIKGLLGEQITFRQYDFHGPDNWRTTDGLHLGAQSTFAISSKTVFTPTDNIKLKFYYSHVEDADEAPPTLFGDLTSRTPIARPDGTLGYYYTGAVHYNFSTPSWGLPTTQLSDPGIRHNQDRYSFFYDAKIFGQTLSGFASHSLEKYEEQLDGGLYLSGPTSITLANSVGGKTTVNYGVNYNSSFFNYALAEKDTQYEVRLTSPSSWRLRYTIGYNYSNIDGHATLRLLNGTPIFNANNYGGSFLNPAIDNSVFGGLFLDVTSHLTISAEGRYQHEQIFSKTYSSAAATFGQTLASYSATYNDFLPRVNVQYRFDRNFQVYALFSEGNNPGGFQPITPAQAANANIAYNYPEEKIKNYEGGIKSQWLDGRLIVDAAVYHMDFTNEQLAQTTPVAGTPTGFASIYQPGVAAKATGFEAEADAAITDDFQVRGTIGYGKAQYVNFCSAPYAALTGVQTGLNCRSVNGRQQEGTPALQTSLSGDYTHKFTDSVSGYVRGDWEYQSKVYNEEWDQSWIPAFSTFNARVGIEHGHVTVEGFVKNIGNNMDSTRSTRVTDSRAAAASIYPTLGGFPQTIAGEQNVAGTAKKPRQYGVRVAFKF